MSSTTQAQPMPSEELVLARAQLWGTRFINEFKVLHQFSMKQRDLLQRVNSRILAAIDKEAKTLQSIESMAFIVYKAFWLAATEDETGFPFGGFRPDTRLAKLYFNAAIFYHEFKTRPSNAPAAWHMCMRRYVPRLRAMPPMNPDGIEEINQQFRDIKASRAAEQQKRAKPDNK